MIDRSQGFISTILKEKISFFLSCSSKEAKCSNQSNSSQTVSVFLGANIGTRIHCSLGRWTCLPPPPCVESAGNDPPPPQLPYVFPNPHRAACGVRACVHCVKNAYLGVERPGEQLALHAHHHSRLPRHELVGKRLQVRFGWVGPRLHNVKLKLACLRCALR